MFKKFFTYPVFLVIFLSIVGSLLFGFSIKYYAEGGKKFLYLKNIVYFIAEIPRPIINIIRSKSLNPNKPKILRKHKDKKRFEQFIPNKRNALLVLPRYDHSLSRAVVDIVDLNNFEVIHTYKHDIAEMNAQVQNTEEFPRLKIDKLPIRFKYNHPLLLNDFSIVSNSNHSIQFKIDFCSNLKWINDEESFHHSNMLDHEGNIWVAGQYNPYSKFVAKYNNNINFNDDSIIKINTDGKILQKKSVTEILIENKLVTQSIFQSFSSDPIHLNYIEPAFNDSKYWKKGDLFLSLPILSVILHYRPSTNKIINYIKGPFARQHDVDIISDKEISIFNNNEFVVDNEHSEVMIYNFETKKFRKLFNDQLKKNDFKTASQGLSHIFKDGALMVEEQNHGRIILFNNQGKKEWEFVNKDQNGDIGFISWSRIIEDELFIEKFKSLVKNKKCLN